MVGCSLLRHASLNLWLLRLHAELSTVFSSRTRVQHLCSTSHPFYKTAINIHCQEGMYWITEPYNDWESTTAKKHDVAELLKLERANSHLAAESVFRLLEIWNAFPLFGFGV